jgi:hypothetical protein
MMNGGRVTHRCNEYYEFGGSGLMESVMPVSKVNRDEPREYDRTRLDKAKEEKELGGCLVGASGRTRSVLMHFEIVISWLQIWSNWCRKEGAQRILRESRDE